MSWIKEKVLKWLLDDVIKKLIKWLDGKKVVIGAINLILWVALYAVPAFTPEYNWITVYATMIRDALLAGGINLDSELFNAGVSFTIVGLVDKVRKLIKDYKDERK